MIERPAKSGDIALAGSDGQVLQSLIAKAESEGTRTLAEIMETAIRRLAAAGAGAMMAASHLFDSKESAKLIEALSRVIATGSLLGHVRIQEKMEKAAASNGLDRFADETPFAGLPESVPLLEPRAAIEYFRSLIPRLGIDPVQWGPIYQRSAMTVAAATETALVEKVQSIVLDRLRTGQGFTTAAKDIQDVLERAGVMPANPQYPQMVFRTNAMDSYNVGQQLAVESNPQTKAFFPAWKYLGIRDGRQGKDHEIRFDKYYPNTLPFAIVRGPRVFNCRCTPAFIDKYEWSRLQAQGAVFSTLEFPQSV